jgi:toxin ParE1/3/4
MLMSTTWKNMLACWSLNDFFEQLILSFKTLSEMPRMGVPCGFRRPSLSRLRRWPVKDFENWLIFYQPTRGGVEIVHVLHGSRDITALLE